MTVCFSQFNLEDKEVVEGGIIMYYNYKYGRRQRTRDDRCCGNLKL